MNFDMLERMEKLKKHRAFSVAPYKKRIFPKEDSYLLLDGIGEDDPEEDPLLLETGFEILLDK